MGLADATGCTSSPLLTLTLLLTLPSIGITHKADNLVVAEKVENQNLAGDTAESKTETSAVQSPPPDTSITNALFTPVTNLNEHLKTIQPAFPPHTAHLFSGYNNRVDAHTHRSQGGVPSESAGKSELFFCGCHEK